MGAVLPSIPVTAEDRPLPTVILSSGYDTKIRDFDVCGAQIISERKGSFIFLTEEGAIDPKNLFEWLIGKEVYVSEPHRGKFDVIFKYLPPKCIRHLATAGMCFYKDFTINVFSNDGMVSIRRGNKWGHLSNVYKIFPEAKTPTQVRLAVELAMSKMWNAGFPDISFRSIGTVVQEIYKRRVIFQPRPPSEHMHMHLQSFRAARMEGVLFGTSDVYDYDIIAAFPSHIAQLVTTRGMEWSDETNYLPNAVYGAALCDVHINEKLVRGPIAVREGKDNTYFPVGYLPNVWLNKPDMDLLYDFPQLGEVNRIHKASWGSSPTGSRPFNRVMRQLFNIRENDSFLAPYIKFVMAAFWGKFVNSYTQVRNPETGEGYLQGSSLYNTAFASHVTSTIRSQLYRRGMHKPIVGEFIDGLSSSRPLSVAARGFGQVMIKGQGSMTLFNDYRKSSLWKNPDLGELAWEQRDKHMITRGFYFVETLRSAFERYGETEAWSHIGNPVDATDSVRLGSSIRFMGNERYRVGHYLEDTISSYPPLYNELAAFRLTKKPYGKELEGSV